MRPRWLAITSARESPERGGIRSTFGGHNSCNSNCTPAAQCGDGKLQQEWGEGLR